LKDSVNSRRASIGRRSVGAPAQRRRRPRRGPSPGTSTAGVFFNLQVIGEHEIAPERPDTVSHLASVRLTTVSMTNPTNHVEIITSVRRRRRWTASEKVRMVEETFEPGMTVSLVARQRGDSVHTLARLSRASARHWLQLVATTANNLLGSRKLSRDIPGNSARSTRSC
jgi:hypothetical protein